MGTRSTIRVTNNGKTVLRLYGQFDGYLSWTGKQLAEFVLSAPFVNGLSCKGEKAFNGMGCFAAQLVAHLKDSPGGWYCTDADADADADDEEFNYEIAGGLGEDLLPKPVTISVRHYGEQFSGSPTEFLARCTRPDEDEA